MPDLTSARPGGDGPVRPGSMTAVMRAARPTPSEGPPWLRWARVENGRIVHEEVRSPDRPLTAGAAGDADVALPDAGFERRAVATFDGGWRLHVAPGWTGRLPQGLLSELGALGADGWRAIELDDDARGRIELGGDVALLVQLVDRPAPKRTAPLPAAVDGGLMQGADWWFTAFVTGSFLVHFAVVAFLAQMDWPVDTTTTVIPDRIANVIFPPAEPPIDPPVETMDPDATDDALADADDADAEPDADRADEPTHRPRRVADARPNPGEADADPSLVARQEVDRAVHQLLGALGGGSGMRDLLREGRDTEGQADLFADMDRFEVPGGDGPDAMPPRDRGCTGECARRARGLGRLAAHEGTGPVGEGAPIEEVQITVRPPGIDTVYPEGPVEFDARELLRVLRHRMTAVRRCYEHELTRGDPNIEGRITLAMEVMPVGTLARVRAEDNTTGSDALEACVVRAIRSTRVRGGPEEPVTVRYPVVFARGAL